MRRSVATRVDTRSGESGRVAIAPWQVAWDDHGVDNNWVEDIPANTDSGQLNDATERFRQPRSTRTMTLRALSVATGADGPAGELPHDGYPAVPG